MVCREHAATCKRNLQTQLSNQYFIVCFHFTMQKSHHINEFRVVYNPQTTEDE